MTTNNKGRSGGDRATHRYYDNAHYIKPSRINRKQKRGWKAVRK